MNPDAVLLVLDSVSDLRHAPSVGLTQKLWRHSGPGEVRVLAALSDAPCHRNCTALGAVCIALDPDMAVRACVCPNGVLLDFNNAKCNGGRNIFSFVCLMLMGVGNI